MNISLSSFKENISTFKEIKFRGLDFLPGPLPCAPIVAGKIPYAQVCWSLWEVSQELQSAAIQMGAVCGPPEM